jgi:2-polyprenyl-3-methyl-5-hydroxy-6-metoxy-1,4-benzoquinol methylase
MWKQEYTNMYELEDDYWWYIGIHELIEHYVREEAAEKRLNILDAGCGTGKLMTILDRYGDVTGFDFSEEAVRYSRERGADNVSIQDLNEWDPPRRAYHVVTCIDVLCHSAIRDVSSILAKFHSSLEEGGLLILNLPAFECLRRQHDIVVNTVRRCRRRPFRDTLREAGFTVEVASYRLAVLFLIILMRKLLGVFEARNKPASDLKVLPPAVNSLMLSLNRAENVLISRGLYPPLGSSLFVVARKKTKDPVDTPGQPG